MDFFRVTDNNIEIECRSNKCNFSCADSAKTPSLKTVTCANPKRRKWLPNHRRFKSDIECQDASQISNCGPVTQLVRFEKGVEFECDGRNTCQVKCPAGLKPNFPTVTCLNVKRKKTFPRRNTMIKCGTNMGPLKPPKPPVKPGKPDAVGANGISEQPLTDPKRARGACGNLRSHPKYNQWLNGNKQIVVNCQTGCQGTKCRKFDKSVCKLFCASSTSKQSFFEARCLRNSSTRRWSISNPPANKPTCVGF
jgi:hypothetical protein